MRQIQADRGGEEIFQRHLIDGQRAGAWIEMHGRVDMRAGVIRHRERQRLRAEHGVACGLLFAVIAPHRHHHGRMRGMRLRAMENLAAEVDEFHYAFLRASVSSITPRWRQAGGPESSAARPRSLSDLAPTNS